MIKLFKQYLSLQSLFFFVGESLAILAGVIIYTGIHTYGTHPTYLVSLGFFLRMGVVVITCQIVFHYMELYKSTALERPDMCFFRVLQSLGVIAIIFSLFTFLSPEVISLQGNPLSLICFVGFLVLGWRFLGAYLLDTDFLVHKILVIGTWKIATTLIQEVEKHTHRGMKIIGLIDKEESSQGRLFLSRYSVMSIQEGLKNIHNNGSMKLVVALDDRRGNIPLNELVECKVRGVEVEDHVTFMEKLLGKLMVESLNPSHLIFTDGFRKSRTLRTAIEMVTAFCALVCLSPLILLISLLIKLDSRGPVFFRQERVGENGKVFFICKFRSMYRDAEEDTGPVWAQEDDDRVTRVGKLLRKFRIDEVPQLWNVMKGEMSFIGPRPERPCFVHELSKAIPYYNLRHTVKPGISGWAQVRYRYGATLEDAFEKLRYDLYYIKHRSPLFEFFILFETGKIVLFGEGAR
jgi:sugar transferase (PEP-CTERM system associated)